MALAEFDLLRQAQQRKTNSDMQSSDDAIKRRFAAQGGLNSGAYLKTANINANKIREDADTASQNIGFQEATAQRGIDEAQKGRDFQAGESQKGRDFQKEISDKDFAFKDKVFSFDSSSKLRELDLADKQFSLDKDTTEFNKRLALMEADNAANPPGLFGQGGILGSGIGGKNGFMGMTGNGSGPLGTVGKAYTTIVGGSLGGITGAKAGGGTVFCTELRRQGHLTDRQHLKAAIFGARWLKRSPDMFYGYQIWATVVVRLMRNHRWINALLVPPLYCWAREITGDKNLIGRIVLALMKPISKIVGVLNRSNVESKEVHRA